MLTEIEWWGGVVFVLGAITYRLVMGALEKQESGIDWYRLQMHAFFLLPAVVLAGYFYPLARTGLQYAYLGVLALSLLVVLVMLVQEITGDSPQEAERKKAATGPAGTPAAAAASGDGNDDEEPGRVMTLVGSLALYSPVLVACGLGCYKAWPLVQRLL